MNLRSVNTFKTSIQSFVLMQIYIIQKQPPEVFHEKVAFKVLFRWELIFLFLHDRNICGHKTKFL